MLYSCSLEETVITKGHVTTANTRAHARTHTVLGLMRTSSRLVTRYPQETWLSFRSAVASFSSPDEKCANLSLDDPNPMNCTQNIHERRQEKQLTYATSETLKSHAGDEPAAARCPVSDPDNNCANGLF